MMRTLILLLTAALFLAGCTTGPDPDMTDNNPDGGDAPDEGEGQTDGNASMDAASGRWGTPEEKVLRPGINMEYDGASCTTSFLLEHEDRLFMATAAHCVARGDGCDPDRELPGKNATLDLLDDSTAQATVAYHSWTTMSRIGEADADACRGNDFALLEIAADDVARAHPASLHFRAPTGLGEAPTDDIWGYGASILKQGVEETHPKQGQHLGMAADGWLHHVYLASPGIPGDSGGHIMTSDGQALGIASTLTILPTTGSNNYVDIAQALAYMEEHEGWAPTLVTWDDFNASLAPN